MGEDAGVGAAMQITGQFLLLGAEWARPKTAQLPTRGGCLGSFNMPSTLWKITSPLSPGEVMSDP